MAPRVDTLPDTDELPTDTDVVIVGGGVVGISTALFLAERGHAVTVVEKGQVAGEQSGRNWGWCREQLRSAVELPIAMLSMRLWRSMSARIGEDCGFRQTGMMIVTRDDDEIARWQAWLDETRGCGIAGGLLDASGIRARLKGCADDWKAAIHSPTDGWTEPATAVPAMARAARRLGVRIVQNCAARGWETSAGTLSHVVTEKGSVRTARVLVAGGAWSSMLMRRHGYRFIQSGVHGTAFRTAAAPEVFAGGVGSPLFSFRRRRDGGYTIGLRGRGRVELSPMGIREANHFLPLFFQRHGGLTLRAGRSFFDGPFAWRRWRLDQASPFEASRSYDPPPEPKIVADGLAAMRAAYPVLRDIEVAESWGGLIDATPDMVPCIGAIPGQPGVFLASGFSGHGMALGPGAGWLTAQLLAGERPDEEIARFRPTRFAEGARHPAHHWI